jgi:hypothetical protein
MTKRQYEIFVLSSPVEFISIEDYVNKVYSYLKQFQPNVRFGIDLDNGLEPPAYLSYSELKKRFKEDKWTLTRTTISSKKEKSYYYELK